MVASRSLSGKRQKLKGLLQSVPKMRPMAVLIIYTVSSRNAFLRRHFGKKLNNPGANWLMSNDEPVSCFLGLLRS